MALQLSYDGSICALRQLIPCIGLVDGQTTPIKLTDLYTLKVSYIGLPVRNKSHRTTHYIFKSSPAITSKPTVDATSLCSHSSLLGPHTPQTQLKTPKYSALKTSSPFVLVDENSNEPVL